MVSQRNWSKKQSQNKQKTGKTYHRKSWNDDYGENTIESVSKKQVLSERKRRFKQNIKRAIQDENYDDLEDFYE